MRGPRAVFLACFAILTAAAAHAQQPVQTYPSRSIRLVVPFPAGGNADIYARPIASKLGELLGQRVVVDNRPGAGGAIGGELVAKAAPDGHTLIMGTTSTFGIGPNLYRNLPYDPVKDFDPIILTSLAQNILIVHPSVPAHSVRQLVALARKAPERLAFASAGIGTSSHVAGELFKSLTHTQMIHVPYKGTSIAMFDLLSGHVDLMFDSLSTALAPVKSGRLRALAVTGRKRLSLIPELPTVSEAGVPGYEVSAWTGVIAPAQTPREIVLRLNSDLNRVLLLAELRRTWAEQGAEPGGGSPEQFASHIRDELAKWRRVVREANIQLN